MSDDVVQWAVILRQRRRLTLGDAILAGTAISEDLTLVTHNTQDFDWIVEMRLLDPLA